MTDRDAAIRQALYDGLFDATMMEVVRASDAYFRNRQPYQHNLEAGKTEAVEALVPVVRQLVDEERLAVRRELTEAVERFEESDGRDIGKLLEVIDPWLLPVTWPAPPQEQP
jgi:hypothetical protein